ncbi:ribosome hibernation-promoting factor, HPF/YfiA family [Labedaea rhizosphaerae]|uniref:Ribosome hibernation promoting factor n=1 Tax=Labedaea rhizosphaerae TaxID=598644 RepID=A0A4R6S2D7_LABRH|nr:ribosome-associated translation inhibitor RaiA [Labedaea rhizosphaerae]TDP93732.1 SSU ribosomal protein S30P /sigma 54 modulation protein [Labedaea rhizosphaerae]
MDIVVKGRNVEVPDHYRAHVEEKVSRLERYDRKVIRFDVELFHEPNRRQAKNCQRVEITVNRRGAAVRAEACAADFYAALDCAVTKLENRLRRLHDRRRVHYGRRTPASVAAATNGEPVNGAQLASTAVLDAPELEDDVAEPGIPRQRWDDGVADQQPGRIVREKEHPSTPMRVDQALYEMELVGHDFYLFVDAETGRPSVVYRRKGFDYGVLSLTT